MAMLRKDHILGAGTGAAAGGLAGAALGISIGGPLGMSIGAVAGTALGAGIGDRIAAARDRRADLGHFEQIYHSMPYYIDGHDWHDYAPAYRYGLDTHARHGGSPFDAIESQLQGGWEAAAHFGSRLGWDDARPAVQHAWHSLDEALQRQPG